MPGMNGVELCRRLHELKPDLPVIVMTAHSDTSFVVESLRAGVEDYLFKPLDLEMLLHRVERALGRREAKVELARLADEMRAVNERLVLSSVREQENAEAAERHRAQLGALLENLSDGVVIVDGEGRVLMVNRAAHAASLGGLPVADVHQINALEALRLDGTPCPVDERPIMRALRGEVFDGYEILRVRGEGDVRRLITSGTNVRGEGGSIELAIVVFRDVTELRRLERERDEYVALISHDLRGPLNNILMAAKLLEQPADAKRHPEDARIVEQIARNAKRMNGMIADLLESTTLESEGVKLHKKPCDLGAIVAGIVHDLDDAHRRRIVFESGARAGARPRGSVEDRAGHHEPRHQRPQVLARGRRRSRPSRPGGRGGRPRGGGPRDRRRAGARAADLRALLPCADGQARLGAGARPVHHEAHRRGPRRPDRGRERGGEGEHVQAALAVARRRGVGSPRR